MKLYKAILLISLICLPRVGMGQAEQEPGAGGIGDVDAGGGTVVGKDGLAVTVVKNLRFSSAFREQGNTIVLSPTDRGAAVFTVSNPRTPNAAIIVSVVEKSVVLTNRDVNDSLQTSEWNVKSDGKLDENGSAVIMLGATIATSAENRPGVYTGRATLDISYGGKIDPGDGGATEEGGGIIKK